MNAELKKRVLAAAIAALFGGVSVPALADMEGLIEKLHDKGVLSDEEYEEMSTEAKAERREEAEAAAKASDPNKLSGSFKEGFKWASKDGKNSIQLAGRVQLDYRSFDNPTPADGFDIRRVYFGVKGKLHNDWTFEVTSNLDGGDLEYAFLDYEWSDAAQLRMGAFKYLYSFEEITSSRFTDFQERSFVNSWVPGKDVGLMFYGQPKKNVYSYSLGVANGEGKNSNETSATEDGKDIIARGAVNFAPMAKWDNGILHLGVGYANGSVAAGSPGSQRTEARGLTFFTATAPTGTSMDRTRTNLEGVVAYGPFKLQTEFNTANYSGDAGYDQDIDTSYIAGDWLITGETYIENYSINGMKSIEPKNSIESGGWGAWQVGVRFSQFDAGGYANSPTSTNQADAVTIGLTWIPNNVTRFILNYVNTDFDTPITSGTQAVSSEEAVTLRAQIYF
jgi:phosphate-selective porin OprO/OprP